MENRISALENDMGVVKSMMNTLIEKIHSRSIAIGELGKRMGKKVDEPAGEESEQMQQQCVVLSELRKRIDRMLLPQREEVQKVKIEIGDDSKMEKLQVKYAEKEMDSRSLQKSSEPSNQNLQSHKESMAWLDAAIEKKEADNRAVNVKENQVVVIDSPLPEPPNAFPPAKVLWEPELANDVLKMATMASQVARDPTPFRPRPKPPDRRYSVELLDPNSQEQPPSETTDSGQPATTLLRRVPLPPEPPDDGAQAVVLLSSPQLLEPPPDTASRVAKTPQSPAANFDSGSGKGNKKMEEYLCLVTTEGEKNPEEIRVKWAFDELSILLNPMVHIQGNICLLGNINILLRKVLTNWYEIEIIDKLGVFVLANSFVYYQGHVSENGLCMKLKTCDHDVVVFKLVDTYSKLCDHNVVVSLLMDTYCKLVSLDFALWVIKNWVIFIVPKELNHITSIEFLSGPSPLSREESPLLEVAVIQDSFLSIPFNWKIYFIYHDDSQGKGEAAAKRIVVFPSCDWDCSSGERPRNSTVDRNLSVFCSHSLSSLCCEYCHETDFTDDWKLWGTSA
jgi:hypothetical protein